MSYVLNPVKTSVSYTGSFVGSTADPCYSKGLLKSSPSIHLAGNSFLFNYLECSNSNDLKFLKRFFSGLTVGSTFAFSNGQQVNIETGAVTYWDGTLTLQGITGNYNELIYASGITYNTGITSGLHNSTLFTKPVQFTATTGITCQYFLSVSPAQDPWNIHYLGLYGDDFGFEEYIDVSSSITNTGRLKVDNSIQLANNQEIIYIDPTTTVTNENLYFKKSFITLYMRGSLPIEIDNYDQTINGVVKISTTMPGIYTNLLENQNRQQYALRNSSVANVGYSWYPNMSLKYFNTNALNVGAENSYQYNAIYHLYYTTTTTPRYLISSDYLPPTVIGNVFFNAVYINNAITASIVNTTTVAQGKTFKIDLSDARNKDLLVEPFLDEQCTIPLIDSYMLIGTPGKEGAAFIFSPLANSMYYNIYLKLTRETVTIVTISLAQT